MGGNRGARHRCKELLYSLEQELRSDYGLSVIESRALVQRVAEFLDQVYEEDRGSRSPGQVRVVAVAEGQPAGRPLSRCVTVPVLVTLLAPSDAELQQAQGSRALRKARLLRVTHEARRLGGLLSYEDLALLLAVDVSTVQRLVKTCRCEGLDVPTRGWVADIGPGSTHKARVIELYFRGLQPAQIASYTAHALSSVERYLRRFNQVREFVRYLDKTPDPTVIARILGIGEKLARAYLELLPADERPAE